MAFDVEKKRIVIIVRYTFGLLSAFGINLKARIGTLTGTLFDCCKRTQTLLDMQTDYTISWYGLQKRLRLKQLLLVYMSAGMNLPYDYDLDNTKPFLSLGFSRRLATVGDSGVPAVISSFSMVVSSTLRFDTFTANAAVSLEEHRAASDDAILRLQYIWLQLWSTYLSAGF
ncbi:hypothetical protein OK016_13105 [Vibrio chagasii]|nr:hypothetical protein [Vibrio chagasii]